MNTVGKVVMLAASLTLLVGCTRIVDGSVQPAADLAPRPLGAAEIAQVLPDADELSEILDQRIIEDIDGRRALEGGVDEMADGLATESDASPHDCVGAATPMQRSVYESADVTEVIGEGFEGDDDGGAILAAGVGVVALDSVADANKLFDTFAEQWQDCDGTTVTIVKESVRGGFFTDHVTDVRVEDSVVAATIEFGHTVDSTVNPVARALGVRANCLVEVDVAYYSDPQSHPKGNTDVDSVAIDIAHLMMDHISDLS
ncbi:sensor domain-containing protein [Mycolicibacterium goodii]|uniref:Lipoprotein, LppR n=1 Tax=Mycolicibacterium goodii TaxID=134601 RepID=A0A0K0X7P5_MYCGD|nr:lipoprotein, LppR [Mycolicibacterium goodii]